MDLVFPKPTEWKARFETHQQRIQQVCSSATIEHIGSTAISGIRAKDVVDVLVGVELTALPMAAKTLSEAGYVLEGQREGHAWLCWPVPEQREAVIHLVEFSGDIWRKRLAFRDYLRQQPDAAKAYESLKLKIAAQTDDWGSYTSQKAAFVTRILECTGRASHGVYAPDAGEDTPLH